MITKELCETLGLTGISDTILRYLKTLGWRCLDVKIQAKWVMVYVQTDFHHSDWWVLAELPESCDENLILTQLKLAMN